MAAKKATEISIFKKAELEAAALPKLEVTSMAHMIANLIRANVLEGRKNVLEQRAVIDTLHKKPQWDRVERIEIVVTKLLGMNAAIPAPMAGDKDLAAKVARMWELRGYLLPLAEMLSSMNLLPQPDVAKIRRGRGSLNGANDVVAIIALLNKHDAAVCKYLGPVTPAMLVEGVEIGEALGLKLLPKAAKKPSPVTKEQRDAQLQRDRLFTILDRDYDHTWRLGALVFGRDVDTKVPAMMSRVAGKRTPKA